MTEYDLILLARKAKMPKYMYETYEAREALCAVLTASSRAPTWYLAQNIKPVEDETVLVHDRGSYYLAHWLVEEWWDQEERHIVLGPDAYWTDLPKP